MNEIEWLYYHLWLKPHMVSINIPDPDEYEKAKEKRRQMTVIKFPFKTPETLILKDGKFSSWYFKSKEGVILK